jgi:hypothetical protein
MLEHCTYPPGVGASITVVGDTTDCTCSGRRGAEKFDKMRAPSLTSLRGTGVPTPIKS